MWINSYKNKLKIKDVNEWMDECLGWEWKFE